MSNPMASTRGTVSLAYYAKITVSDAEHSPRDAEALKVLLERAIDESEPGAKTGARCTGVQYGLPDGGTERFVIAVTAAADLDEWNKAYGPGQTATNVQYRLAGVLEQVDVSSVPGAVIDAVDPQMCVVAPPR
jgi:hypothetical protein